MSFAATATMVAVLLMPHLQGMLVARIFWQLVWNHNGLLPVAENYNKECLIIVQYMSVK